MVENSVIVTNSTGLHARPAKHICSQAQKFKSKIEIVLADKVIDAKSILNIMACAIGSGAQLTIRCHGEDETLALDTMVAIIADLND